MEQSSGSSGHEQVARHQPVPADCCTATVSGLEPGVTYKFIVEALVSVRTAAALESASDSTTTFGDTRTTTVLSKPVVARTRAPCEPPRPIITGYTPTTVRLHWQRPLLEAVTAAQGQDHHQRRVRLSLEGYRLDINGQPHMRLSPATHECTLVKCRPGKTYSITLIALTYTENAKKARSKKVSAVISGCLVTGLHLQRFGTVSSASDRLYLSERPNSLVLLDSFPLQSSPAVSLCTTQLGDEIEFDFVERTSDTLSDSGARIMNTHTLTFTLLLLC